MMDILERVRDGRIFDISKDDDGTFQLSEMCDECFAVWLSKDEMVSLGEAIIAVANERIPVREIHTG